MGDVFNELRAEIAELRKLIFAARDKGVPEHDPELRGYVRTLHAREELLERLEQPGGDIRRSRDPSVFIRRPVATTGTGMADSEAEQLREEIEALRSLLNSVVGRRSGDTVLVEACEEAIRERLERLKEHGHGA